MSEILDRLKRHSMSDDLKVGVELAREAITAIKQRDAEISRLLSVLKEIERFNKGRVAAAIVRREKS